MLNHLQSRARDFQKSKVYKWEATLSDFYQSVALEDCASLVQTVWIIYSPRAKTIPKISFGRNGKIAWATDKRIHLPGKTRILGIVLHEAVHSVLYPDISVTHCPIFMLYLTDIYRRFGIGGIEIDLEKSALDAKLQISEKNMIQVPITNRKRLVAKEQ